MIDEITSSLDTLTPKIVVVNWLENEVHKHCSKDGDVFVLPPPFCWGV